MKLLKKFKGPFSKKDGYIDYKEAHSFVLGINAGAGIRKQEKAFQRDKDRMNHGLEWHYWTIGYRISNKGKWGLIGILSTVFGPQTIEMILHGL